MKARMYINNVLSIIATERHDVRALINRAFTRIRRGENVRLEIN